MILLASARVSGRDIGAILVSPDELCAAVSGIMRSFPVFSQT
jgi:hypothetical protein